MTDNPNIADIMARKAYKIGLLYENEPAINLDELHDRLNTRIGNVQLMSEDACHFAFLDYGVTYADDSVAPAQCVMTIRDIQPDTGDISEEDIVQSWGWQEAKAVVECCRSVLEVSDFLAAGLPSKPRLALFHNIVLAVLDVAPCEAIHWTPSLHYVEPADYVRSKSEADPNRPTPRGTLFPAINVRRYDIAGRAPGEKVFDSIGAADLGVVDVQCHFAGIDQEEVEPIVFKSAFYLFHTGDTIDQETQASTLEQHLVRDAANGVGPAVRWRCSLRSSLAPPNRLVLDLDAGAPI